MRDARSQKHKSSQPSDSVTFSEKLDVYISMCDVFPELRILRQYGQCISRSVCASMQADHDLHRPHVSQ